MMRCFIVLYEWNWTSKTIKCSIVLMKKDRKLIFQNSIYLKRIFWSSYINVLIVQYITLIKVYNQ